jgi:hypothetical protein
MLDHTFQDYGDKSDDPSFIDHSRDIDREIGGIQRGSGSNTKQRNQVKVAHNHKRDKWREKKTLTLHQEKAVLSSSNS